MAIDLTSLYRHRIGFDRSVSLLEDTLGPDPTTLSYPA